MRDLEGYTGRSGPVSFGFHVRRRRLALDLTQAALAGRVGCSAAMIKKIEHDQRRPSRRLAQRLAEGLELTQDEHERFVAVALGERSGRHLEGRDVSPVAAPTGDAEVGSPDRAKPPPAWLTASVDASASELAERIVGRDAELRRLESHVRQAAEGQGRVVFVTGEAGQGKTSLLTALGARAHLALPDLVVAEASGTAASGVGDPYLLFRDLLLMLLADPQARWHRDRVHSDQLARLWEFAPHVARTLHTVGPGLVDVLVPGTVVAERSGVPESDDERALAAGLARPQLFGQLTSVLHHLSRQRPVLLLLDDLQWIDVASAELLFHLARSLTASRVLVVCAYRESEVATGNEPAAELLRRTSLEVARDHGDAGLDLEDAGTEAARHLSDALVDREPNRLDEDFRRRLFAQTRGHPLFTLELLRELRRRGDLVRDEHGRWVARPSLEWHALPGRVAAAVEQRLQRLDGEVRTILDVAAVVGEQFAAEVVAGVCDLDDRRLVRRLSTELAGLHGLVSEVGPRQVGDRWVSQWRFSHALFQAYLYDQLAAGERRYLHKAVADRIVGLHGEDSPELVPSLAYHYAQAGDTRRALPYLLRAADRARALYATDEAVHHYRIAVELLRSGDDEELLARTLLKLGLTHETAFDRVRAQEAYDEAFSLWRRRAGPSRTPQSTATLRMLWRDPGSLDPTLGGYNVIAPVTTQLFSGLVTIGEDGEVLPDVAERWELEGEGRRYVFHLRGDVVWSDGTPFTADDAATTYRRALDPATGATTARSLLDAVRGARRVHEGVPIEEVELGISAPDERTLVIELEEPTSYFIQNLAYYVLLPTPRHAVATHGDDWATQEHLVGSGPFVVASWERGRSLVLERNPRYHGTVAGNVDRVELRLDAPDEDHEALYEAGEIDVVRDWFTPGPFLAGLAERHPDEYVVRPEHTTLSYLLNASRPPLSDPRVRQALALTVDREAVASLYPPGAATVARGGIVPPGMPGHVADLQPWPDAQEAARLLEEAARTVDLHDHELVIAVPSRAGQLADVLAGSWERLGLPMRVRLVDSPPSVASADEDVGDIGAGGWVADYADPDNFLRVFVGLNLSEFPAGYQELLTRAALSRAQDERLALYQEAERVLAEAGVIVPLVYRSSAFMLKPWVQRFVVPAVKHVGFWKDVTIAGRRA